MFQKFEKLKFEFFRFNIVDVSLPDRIKFRLRYCGTAYIGSITIQYSTFEPLVKL